MIALRPILLSTLGVTFGIALSNLVIASGALLPEELLLRHYLTCMFLMWGCLGTTSFVLPKSDHTHHAYKIFILISAIIFRCICLTAAPIFEDDFWRYLFDGWLFSHFGTPYGFPPVEFLNDPTIPHIFQEIVSKINYPEFSTIYGPTLEYIFLFAFYLDPGNLLAIKAFILVADIAIFICLWNRATLRGLLLYAWCPLLLQECYFSGHPDLLGAAPLFLAATYIHEKKYTVLTGILSGVAFASKVTAFPILCIGLMSARFKSIIVGLITAALLYVPFYRHEGKAEFAIVGSFLSQWEFNPSIYKVIRYLTTPITEESTLARLICAAIFSGFLLFWIIQNYKRSPQMPIRGDIIIGTLLLFSPVVNPWYLLWILPFVALHTTRWGIAALIVAPMSYLHGLYWKVEGLRPFEIPLEITLIEYGIIFFAIIWERNRRAPGL